jgi:hypothetical protein
LTPYNRAQRAMADIKAAVHQLLSDCGLPGLSNAQIGRALGIYSGHEGHEGHISRTLLAIMQKEGVVEQDSSTLCWRLRSHTAGETAE